MTKSNCIIENFNNLCLKLKEEINEFIEEATISFEEGEQFLSDVMDDITQIGEFTELIE